MPKAASTLLQSGLETTTVPSLDQNDGARIRQKKETWVPARQSGTDCRHTKVVHCRCWERPRVLSGQEAPATDSRNRHQLPQYRVRPGSREHHRDQARPTEYPRYYQNTSSPSS